MSDEEMHLNGVRPMVSVEILPEDPFPTLDGWAAKDDSLIEKVRKLMKNPWIGVGIVATFLAIGFTAVFIISFTGNLGAITESSKRALIETAFGVGALGSLILLRSCVKNTREHNRNEIAVSGGAFVNHDLGLQQQADEEDQLLASGGDPSDPTNELNVQRTKAFIMKTEAREAVF